MCNEHRGIPVVVLSAVEEQQIIQRTIDRSAVGFIPKHASNKVLVSALQLVLAGDVYIPTEILNKHNDGTPAAPAPANYLQRPPKLTERQIDVLYLLSNGESNKVIAGKLGLSEEAIKIHISAIFKVLGVNKRTAAALAYREIGLQTQTQ